MSHLFMAAEVPLVGWGERLVCDWERGGDPHLVKPVDICGSVAEKKPIRSPWNGC